MRMTTISVKKETLDRLRRIKVRKKFNGLDELINYMIDECFPEF